jgi:Bacterial Ig domain
LLRHCSPRGERLPNGPTDYTFTTDGLAAWTAPTGPLTFNLSGDPQQNPNQILNLSQGALYSLITNNAPFPLAVGGDSSVSIVSGPQNGTLTPSGWGGYFYTPNPGFVGTDQMTLHVHDLTPDSVSSANYFDVDVTIDYTVLASAFTGEPSQSSVANIAPTPVPPAMPVSGSASASSEDLPLDHTSSASAPPIPTTAPPAGANAPSVNLSLGSINVGGQSAPSSASVHGVATVGATPINLPSVGSNSYASTSPAAIDEALLAGAPPSSDGSEDDANEVDLLGPVLLGSL